METLKAVRQLGAASPREVYEILNNPYIHVTAVNQRLDDLIKLGFLRRERQGRMFRYTPIR